LDEIGARTRVRPSTVTLEPKAMAMVALPTLTVTASLTSATTQS